MLLIEQFFVADQISNDKQIFIAIQAMKYIKSVFFTLLALKRHVSSPPIETSFHDQLLYYDTNNIWV